jgi:hypothetical protein
MRAKWQSIRNKKDSSYQLTRKNCADIVLRVLVAGGVKELLPGLSVPWLTHHPLYTSPKNVAQLCNKLRDGGKATKAKSASCPTKANTPIKLLLLGLR